MLLDVSVFNPKRLKFDLTSTYSHPPQPHVSMTTDMLRLNAHGVTDEQMVVAYSLGMIEQLSLIAERKDGYAPFVSLTVAIPGVSVSYFWSPDELDQDSPEGLARALAQLLNDAGEGRFIDLYHEVCRRAKLTPDADLVASEDEKEKDIAEAFETP